ncbi:MAG: stage 0 sporulation family protein [Firmicutes bacterium]|nr:stage 0 sporulation family protein [Bacillota bacterium]
MKKVVGIKFARSPKVYYFDPGELEYRVGVGVIVETAKGVEYGTVSAAPFEVDQKRLSAPLKPVMRLATAEDNVRVRNFDEKRTETLRSATELIEQSGLAMKPVDAEYTFDGQKLIIYFTADSRVDFRDLVRKLASAFRMRIELRQIGVRDECRMIGGLGVCGRVCCCNSCMEEFSKASIKMAKNQSLSLNPGKISGLCGRLMCCLEYENKTYMEINKRMPKMGSQVLTSDGKEGVVVGLMQLKEKVKLKIPERDSFVFADYPLSELIFKARAPAAIEEPEPDDDIPEELKGLE